MENLIIKKDKDSWRVLSDNQVIKIIDRTVFTTMESGVPKRIKSFFEIEDLKYKDKKEITINYNEKDYKADLKITKTGQAKIHFKKLVSDLKKIMPDLIEKLDKKEYTKEQAPKLIFIKVDTEVYNLEITEIDSIEFKEIIYIAPKEIILPKSEVNELEGMKEGEKAYKISKYYERNPKNRQAAIKHHGTTCCICGFNFEKVYGKLGKDYIEIHHKVPLYTLDKVVKINPITDLVPVCSNCHRMIHRDKNNFKSIEEIKEILA